MRSVTPTPSPPGAPAGPALLATAALALALAGCGGRGDPRSVYVAYLGALSRADTAAAFALLAPESRAWLEADEARWRRGERGPHLPEEPAPDPGDGPPGLALFDRLVGAPGLPGIPRLPDDVERFVGEASVTGARATIQVATPLGPREATLLATEDGWRVRLARD